MNKLITVKTATFASDLSVAVSYLEDKGIKCFLKDAHSVQVYSAATSQGVQLQVLEQDVEQALELLIEGGFVTRDEYTEEYSDWLTRLVDKVIEKINQK